MKVFYNLFCALLIVCLLGIVSCKKEDKFTIKGKVAGAEGKVLYFEHNGVNGVEFIDSVVLNNKGSFEFKGQRPDAPDFYRLRYKDQLINLAVDSIETIDVTADAGAFPTLYDVKGSDDSKKMRELALAQLDANQLINRLINEYEHKLISDSAYLEGVDKAVADYKAVASKYIYSNPRSAAAYFALFQQVNNLLLLDPYDKTDSKAYGAVATSWNMFYPNSARTKQLVDLAMSSIKTLRAQRNTAKQEMAAEEVSYFDIELPNNKGEIVQLTDIAKGKTVLVNFTAYQAEWSPAQNMMLADLYKKYKDKGFEIYQVSLDSDAHFWKNVSANLPWITVIDPRSVYSQTAALYNVRQLPAMFIIDKKGNLVKRVENFNKLEDDIKSYI